MQGAACPGSIPWSILPLRPEMGVESYPLRREGEVRVICKIKPEHTTTMG